jgi:predicted transcriptional regulator
MPKEAVFTMKLEAELRDAFMAEAEAADRPASQIVREMMKDFIAQREEERGYDQFLRRKVGIAMASVEAGRGRTQEDVSADFTKRRAELLARDAENDR